MRVSARRRAARPLAARLAVRGAEGASSRVSPGAVATLFANITYASRKAVAYAGAQPVQLMGLVDTHLSATKVPRVATQLRALGVESWVIAPLFTPGSRGVPPGGILIAASD